MNKYINAKDLLNEAWAESVEGRIFDDNTYVGTFNVVPIGDITEIVNHMPAADVVEVVRCKDCSHYIEPYCARFITAMIPVNENDFCSRGKWRESE